MKRTLFQQKNNSISIKIEIYKTNDEKIIIHGHDIGKIVKKIKHKSDYEYYVTIEKEEIQSLIEKVGLKNVEELFDWFIKNYSTDKAVSQIKAKLEELQIKYQFSTW